MEDELEVKELVKREDGEVVFLWRDAAESIVLWYAEEPLSLWANSALEEHLKEAYGREFIVAEKCPVHGDGCRWNGPENLKGGWQYKVEHPELGAECSPGSPVLITYKNWRGEVYKRQVYVMRFWFGSTEYHQKPQMLMRATHFVEGKGVLVRDYAVADISDMVQV